jgi:hypothetical protein
MFDSWMGLKPNPEAIGLAVGVLGLLVAAVIYAVRKHLRGRPTAEEVERRRRVALQREGKMGDGEIVDVMTDSGSIVYSYSVAGVIYTATQDLSALQPLLPADAMTMVGPVSVKYDPRNPANSIVLCEDWSGLRTRVFDKGVR